MSAVKSVITYFKPNILHIGTFNNYYSRHRHTLVHARHDLQAQ